MCWSRWPDCVHEIPRAHRVQNLSAPDPSASRQANAKLEILEIRGRMRVGGNHKPDVSLASLPRPARLHIQSVRITADLNSRPGLGNRIEYFFDSTGNWWTSLNQTSHRMAPHLEQRISHCVYQSAGHLVFVELVTVVNAGNDHIELFEDPIGIV